ncbi:MAG: universal stress protein [Bacteroidota bacterium]|nr:universal stress protein [Bacteroidota bacterium]
MKTILVPTDFSKNADNALEYAIEIAKKEKANILLLHAFHITYIYPDVPIQYASEEIHEAEEAANKKLKKLCSKVISDGEITCESICKQGMVVHTILEITKKKKVDLIVMGTKGASGIKEFLFGSNTARVIEKSKRPVIAVPEKAAFSPIKNITYASDYESNDIKSLTKLVDIARLFGAKITVLHVYYKKFSSDEEDKYMNRFKNKVKSKIQYTKIGYKIIYGNSVFEALEKHVQNDSPDLLSMSTHERGILDKIFGASLTKAMAYHSKVPLMAFHNKKTSSLLA